MSTRTFASPKALVEAFLLEVRSGKNPNAASEFMANLVDAHQVTSEQALTVQRTPQQYADHVREMQSAYGNFEFEIEELIAEGDKVYARWSHRGKHLGEISGYPATGKPITQLTSCVYRVENGLIVEYWIQIDRLGIELQLRQTS